MKINSALILSCKECGHQIDLVASKCPNCGSRTTTNLRFLIVAALLVIIWIFIKLIHTSPVNIDQGARDNTSLQYTLNSLIFGTALTPDFTIKNLNNVPIKNIAIKCDEINSEGAVVDSMNNTISQTIPAKGTRTFLSFDMGSIINNQTSTINCIIISVDAIRPQ